jgi:hypothetical protein
MGKKFLRLIFLLLAFCTCLTSCSPCTKAYRDQYAHLNIKLPKATCCKKSEYFVVLLVDARHLDYSNCSSLLRTIAKHPSDGSKNGDVGHAWIYLQGVEDGKIVSLEGGHSGELGVRKAKYFEGVMNYIEYGYANPSPKQKCCYRYEPNPIKYLWSNLNDGFFQYGSSYHKPTFAAKIDLTKEQFQSIIKFIENYDYSNYSITRNQCSTFVAQISALAGLSIECEMTIHIDQTITFRGETFVLWTDPCYQSLTFSTPDIIEKSLIQAICEGKADNAMDWYQNHLKVDQTMPVN